MGWIKNNEYKICNSVNLAMVQRERYLNILICLL